MNSQTQKLALGLGLSLVLVAGGASAYLGGEGERLLTPKDAVLLIPQEVTVTGFVNTDPQIWSQVSQFGTPEAQKLLSDRLNTLPKEVLHLPSINYQEDIQPWIGNVMWAILPDHQTENETNLLLVIGIKDQVMASNFLEKLAKQPEYQTEKVVYQGVTIIQTTTQDQTSFSLAVIGNQILVSNRQQTIEKSIDVYKGEPSYGQKVEVQEAINQKFSFANPLAQLYFIPNKTSFDSPLVLPGGIPAMSIKEFSAIKSIVVGVDVVKQGLHLQALTNAKSSPSSSQENSIKPLANKTVSQFPKNTIAFVNGQGISQSWNRLVTKSKNDPESKSFVNFVRETSNQQLSLNADKDIFSWMNGEYAAGLIPVKLGSVANLGMGGVILWQTSNPKTAQNTLNKLNSVGQKSGLVKIKKSKIGGKSVTEWKNQQQVLLSHAWLNNNSLALSLGIPLTPILNTQSVNSLADSTKFKTLTATFPKQNLGYGYLDVAQIWSKAIPLIEMTDNEIPSEMNSFFNSVKGVAATASFPNYTVLQLDLILALKSSNQKK